MSPYDYLKNNVNVKLSPSKIHGVGIFAIRDIEVGEKIFVNWEGESGLYYITEEELNSLYPNLKSHLYDMFEFMEVDNKWLFGVKLNKNCHWIFKTPLHWVNSCSWNEEPNIDSEKLITTKRILSGQELFTKYGKYEKFKPSGTNQII
jgi:hypothetical protein